MLFSTRAEYGVRLMVELGRHAGERRAWPVSLSAVAESENLPLSYLEHLVAKLRKDGLVESQRGAHGGYRLGRPAEQIDMLEVVQALEGAIAPMECFHGDARGQGLLFARDRRRRGLRHQAAVDPGAGRRHQGAVGHHARRPRRVRRRPVEDLKGSSQKRAPVGAA